MATLSRKLTAQINQTLDTKPLTPTISAFTFTRTFDVSDHDNWFNGATLPHRVSGIAYNESIGNFIAGKAAFIAVEHKLVFVPPTVLAIAQKLGYPAATDTPEWHNAVNVSNKNPMNAPLDWQLIHDDRSAHMIFDADMNVLPIALEFGYIEGDIRDGRYDLVKLINHLNTRVGVHPVEGDSAIELLDVPYYNVSQGCSQYCRFIFSPTKDEMQLIWSKAQQISRNYPSCYLVDAVIQLDLLGIEAMVIQGKE